MTGQNTSSAVMQQRHEPADSLDYFPTPAWATRALLEFVVPHAEGVCGEPACGEGHMARPLSEHFAAVIASDIFDYGYGDVLDFLLGPGDLLGQEYPAVDWIITNPPFVLAKEFVLRALQVARVGVAMLVRVGFLETSGRHKRVFVPYPPSVIAVFAERVVIVKGRVVRKGSTATMYIWVVWQKGWAPSPTIFIPPCRARLERPEDYR